MTCEKQSWCLSSGQPNSETWETNRFGHLAYSASLTLPFPPFPGGPVVQNPPADAEDTGSAPGLGWRHVRWHSQACAPGACAPQQETSPRPRARRPRAENALCSSKGPRQSKKKRPEPHETSWSHNALYLSEGLAVWTAPSRNLNGLLLGGIQNSDSGVKTELEKALHWQRGRPSWNWELRASFWNAGSPAQFRVNGFLTSS